MRYEEGMHPSPLKELTIKPKEWYGRGSVPSPDSVAAILWGPGP